MKRDARAALAIGGGVLALYLLSMSYAANDPDGDAGFEVGLAVAEDAAPRSYHLLHTPLMRLVLGLFRLLGFGGEAFVPIQVCNSLSGASAAALLVPLGRRLGLSLGGSVWMALVFAASATPWRHSRTAETGMTPLPLVLGAVLLLLPECVPTLRNAVGRVVGAAALACGAVLLSLNYVVLVPAMLLALPKLAAAPRQRHMLAGIAVATCMLVGGLPYLAVAISGAHGDPAGFVHWFTFHSDRKGLAVSAGGLVSNVMRSVVGLGRLPFPASEGETAIKAVLRGRQVVVDSMAWLTLGRNLLATALIGLLVAMAARRVRRDTAVRLALGLIACQASFSVVWLGSDPQFWLPVYPFLLGLAALGDPSSAFPTVRRVAVVALLIGTNLPAAVASPLWPFWSPGWQHARQAAQVLPPRPLIIVPGYASLRIVKQIRDDVDVVDLTYTPPESLEGDGFLQWTVGTIRQAHKDGRPVVFQGLREPMAPEVLGRWEMVNGTHAVTRAEVESAIGLSFTLEPTELGEHVLWVRPRR